jgi:hypothetical protein
MSRRLEDAMVFKIVFQVPYNADQWDPDVASALRVETPGDRHGPHIKIAVDIKDAETGEPCAMIRCKHNSLESVELLADRVRLVLPELLGLS